MQPLGTNILIQADKQDKASGMIILLNEISTKYKWGTVLLVGDVNETISEGDRVLYQLGRGYVEKTKEKLPTPTGRHIVALKNIMYWRNENE